jgi:hypothetical protein
MVRSSGGTVRLVTPTQQSRRWVLEYKPVVSHSGWLIKRGHSIRNFKRRLFCILDHELVYHDTHDSTDVRGRIDLRKRTTVQCLLQSGFSLSQGSYQIILYALDQNDRDEWIKHLLEKGAELLPASAKTAKLIEQHTHSAEKQPIVFSGWLRKRGQMFKSTKRRWFELSSTTLSYYSHPEGGTKKGSLEVANARISPLDTLNTGERFSFLVHTTQRELIVHADSQEERSLWVASLSSVAEGNRQNSVGSISSDGTDSFSMAPGAFVPGDRARGCSCASGSFDDGPAVASADSSCRRCMSSFISKTEDALVDVTREVQLILASPYSPEGTTTAAFLKEQAGKPIDNAALREFMLGLSDYMVHKRLNELRALGGRSGASNAEGDGDDSIEFTERVIAIIGEQIEERVFFPLYRTVHDNIKTQSHADSKLLRGKIEVLQSKSQSFFGIDQSSLSTTSWVSACTKLKEIDKLSLPYMKRSQLVAACKEIYNVYHSEHPTSAPMSADDFIPAFIYVLVQSRLSDPVFVKDMITFFDLGGTQGEAAYFVTCLEIAIEYIRSLVTACTVVLDASQKLGIEFARDSERETIVVYRLVAGGQAEESQAVRLGDVLVAVNGVLVDEMDLSEITKMVAGADGEIELCLLPMAEYERRFGAARRTLRGDNESSDDGEFSGDDGDGTMSISIAARRKQSIAGSSESNARSPPPTPALATALMNSLPM